MTHEQFSQPCGLGHHRRWAVVPPVQRLELGDERAGVPAGVRMVTAHDRSPFTSPLLVIDHRSDLVAV